MMIFIAVLILWGGAFRDGISERAENVGWTAWHVAGWIARDLPAAIIALMFALSHHWYEMIIVLFAATGHEQFYRLGVDSKRWLSGPAEPPRWFRIIRKLWSWLPWA